MQIGVNQFIGQVCNNTLKQNVEPNYSEYNSTIKFNTKILNKFELRGP